MEKGVPIRSVARALNVLQAINRNGSLTMTEVARTAEIPYPTACRIVQSLIHEGFIEQEPDRKKYRPTALVQSLSYGYQHENALAALARPFIIDLTKEIGWPTTISTRVADTMVVRDSTHAMTSLTFTNIFPGFSMPILACSSGRAYLAFCSPEERATVLNTLARKQGDGADIDLDLIEQMLGSVKAQGYATMARIMHSTDPGKTSSIAAPLRKGDKVVASLTVPFFSTAMTPAQAIDGFLDKLLKTQSYIEAAFNDGAPDKAEAA